MELWLSAERQQVTLLGHVTHYIRRVTFGHDKIILLEGGDTKEYRTQQAKANKNPRPLPAYIITTLLFQRRL